MSARLFALVAAALIGCSTVAAGALNVPESREPRFELTALGVLGGDIDTNLSSYLLAAPGQPPHVLVDGGTVVDGILRWKEHAGALQPDASWSRRTKVAAEVLQQLQVACFTHAHMDHVGGFIQKTVLDFLLALKGRPTLDIVGMPVTIAAFRDHLLRPPLWIDFTKLPPHNPALKLAPLAPGAWRAAGPFQVRWIEANHPDKGAAFLFTKDGDAYLHVGDTGRCAALWAEVRPWFKSGHLRAITLECSWPAASEKIAIGSGHLTPPSWLLELNELAGVARDLPPAEHMTREQIRQLAHALAPAFALCPIIVTHIKAADYDATYHELEELSREGLNIIIPTQGRTYRF